MQNDLLLVLINTLYLISKTDTGNQLFELTAGFFQEWDYFSSVDASFTTMMFLIHSNELKVHSGRAHKRKESCCFEAVEALQRLAVSFINSAVNPDAHCSLKHL